MVTKADIDPMHRANLAPRCTAKSKRTGLPCGNPAVRGWNVCRMHGAGGGARHGPANPNWKHGGRSVETIKWRRLASEYAREACKLAEGLD